MGVGSGSLHKNNMKRVLCLLGVLSLSRASPQLFREEADEAKLGENSEQAGSRKGKSLESDNAALESLAVAGIEAQPLESVARKGKGIVKDNRLDVLAPQLA